MLRKARLRLRLPEGEEEEPEPDGGQGFWLLGAGEGAERVQSGNVVSGRALRMNLSGTGHFRSTAP